MSQEKPSGNESEAAEKTPAAKKPYARPAIRVLGSVRELTGTASQPVSK